MTARWPLPTPSLGALLLAAGGLFLFFAATNVQSGWLFALDALLWAVWLWDLSVAARPLPAIEMRRHVPPQAAAGEPLDIVVSLQAARPLRHVEIAEPGLLPVGPGRRGPRTSLGYVQDLPAGASSSCRGSLVLGTRGRYRYTGIELVQYGPLGLFRRAWTLPAAGDLWIHPPVATWDEPLAPPASEGQSDGSSRRLGPVGLFAGVRDYRPGDSLRQIHWPLTARRDVLSVKELEPPPSRKLTLVIHLTTRGAATEAAVATAAALAAWAWGQGLPLVLVGPGRCWQPSLWPDVLHWLAEIQAGPLAELPDDPGTIVLIVDAAAPAGWSRPTAITYGPDSTPLASLPTHPFPERVKATLSG